MDMSAAYLRVCFHSSCYSVLDTMHHCPAQSRQNMRSRQDEATQRGRRAFCVPPAPFSRV